MPADLKLAQKPDVVFIEEPQLSLIHIWMYIEQELSDPQRNIATSVLVEGGTLPLCSVRLSGPIPKGKIFDVMAEIRAARLTAPVKAGTVVLGNVLGLGRDVIATKNIPAG